MFAAVESRPDATQDDPRRAVDVACWQVKADRAARRTAGGHSGVTTEGGRQTGATVSEYDRRRWQGGHQVHTQSHHQTHQTTHKECCHWYVCC